jgi:predicted acylesterase/phospholipase RssA
MSGEAIGSRIRRWLGTRPSQAETRPVRVLAIDGGGIRGILPAIILAELERLTGRPTVELFDVVAGTSTGALLGLALTAPDQHGKPRFGAGDVARLYEIGGSRVFSRSVWHQIRAVGNLVDEKYPAAGIEEMLDRVFGEVMLSQAMTETLVPCYDVENRSPFLFTREAARNGQVRDFPMAEVVRAATAAPTFFEPARLAAAGSDDYHALIDGAVIAYNPAIYAYVEAKRLFPEATDFLVVSLGTGQLTRGLPYDEVKNWGAARWAQPLFSLMCDGDAAVVEHQLAEILPPGPGGERRYYRFQGRLTTGSDDMDDASDENIDKIKQLGRDMVLKQNETLRLLAGQLSEGVAAQAVQTG